MASTAERPLLGLLRRRENASFARSRNLIKRSLRLPRRQVRGGCSRSRDLARYMTRSDSRLMMTQLQVNRRTFVCDGARTRSVQEHLQICSASFNFSSFIAVPTKLRASVLLPQTYLATMFQSSTQRFRTHHSSTTSQSLRILEDRGTTLAP